MLADAFGAPWGDIGAAILSTAAIFVAVIVATRLAGLRSFAKMSAFDFAMTVAVGSLVASVGVSQTPVAVGLAGLAALYGLQVGTALLRRHVPWGHAVDNTPRLLMKDGRVLQDQMARARITDDDLRARLRAANVLSYGEVRAVVLETTGDVSVLTGDGELDPDLLRGVRPDG